MEQVSNDFVKELKKRPELGSAFTFYSASFPQYMLRIDNDLAEQKGVTIEKAMDNLSTLIGSNYETSFIRLTDLIRLLFRQVHNIVLCQLIC
jgi:multidrug efflux pump subunit AcrB